MANNIYGVFDFVHTSQKSEPALELHSRAATSVDAHYRVSVPNTGRNSGERQITKKIIKI